MKRPRRRIRARQESKCGQGSAEIEQGSAQAEEGEGENQRVQPVAKGRRSRAGESEEQLGRRVAGAVRFWLSKQINCALQGERGRPRLQWLRTQAELATSQSIMQTRVQTLEGALNPYESADWKRFRAAVIKLDGGVCSRCGRAPDDGAILQVHHKEYLRGRLPWEYRYDACETLCKGCHAAEHGHIPPNYGWEFAGHEDLGDLVGECEKCGTQIRHVFLILHQHWGALEVGEICCDNLTCTELASNHMDSIRRYNERRKTFVSSSRWIAPNGSTERIVQKGIAVEVIKSDGFHLRIFGHDGKLRFDSPLEAKSKVFDLIECGAISDFLERKRELRRTRRSSCR